MFASECTDAGGKGVVRIDAQGMLTPFAGNGKPEWSGDGGPATEAGLYCPFEMRIGPDRALYLADHGNNRIRRIGTDGIITTIAGSGAAGVDQGSYSGDGGPATSATLQEPSGIAFDAVGNLYIGDRDNDRIRKIDLHGVITTIAGDGKIGAPGDGGPAVSAHLAKPRGLIVDAEGNILFAESWNHRIRKIDAAGIISTIAGTGHNGSSGDGGPATSATIMNPMSIAIDHDGNVVFGDTEANVIRRIGRDGTITTIAGTGGDGPSGSGGPALDAALGTSGDTDFDIGQLEFDDAGDLYFVHRNRLSRIDADGIITTVAGSVS